MTEPPTPPLSTAARVGRVVSIVGHPFVLVPAAIAITTTWAGSLDRGAILAVVAGSMVVVSVFVARQLRARRITDVDVSVREHRPRFYLVAIACVGGATAVLAATGTSWDAVRGSAAAAALLCVAALLNRKIKVSLHAAFAVYAAFVVAPIGLAPALAFGAVALAVAWARVAYGRHQPLEVLLGLGLGAAAGATILL